MDEKFCFEETVFVTPAGIGEQGDWHEDDLKQINNIRSLHPEIGHWGSLAIGCAFSGYSMDILAVGWAEWLCEERCPDFLTYIYVKQKCPKFDFGSTGLYDKHIYEYAETLPWKSNAPLPSWVLNGCSKMKSNYSESNSQCL